MNNLTTFYNNVLENNENLYLYFNLGKNNYGISIKNVVEIMKLPTLDYPQKLPNNTIGLLNYNKFTINVLDLRFYLNIKVTPYSTSNQIIIVKTDETIFALIIDKIEDIITINQSKAEYFSTFNEENIIDFLYKNENQTISIINLNSLENIIKQEIKQSEIDIPSLFPQDDDSQYEFMQRSLILREKSNNELVYNIFSQDNFISFSLDENIYCINLNHVKEFLKSQTITPIPCDFDYISGIIVLRGDFVTVINTKKFLGISDSSESEKQKANHSNNKNNIIIVELSEYKIGFLVDEIYDIINIPEDSEKKKTSSQDKYILSENIIDNKLYSILNIKNILSDEKFFIEE